MSCVISCIKKSMLAHSASIAIVHQGISYTYDDLNERANKFAHYLQCNQVSQGCRVAFLMRRSFDMLATIIAIWKLGATYIPLDPKTPKGRIDTILKRVSPTCIVSEPALLDKLYGQKPKILTPNDPELISSTTDFSWVDENDGERLAYIIYTSGSTGEPKGVMLTHANLNNHVNWLIQDFGFSSQDCFSFNSSMAFDFSVATTIIPLAVGAKILITSEEDTLEIKTYCEQLEGNQVSFAKWTPSYFKLLVDYVEQTHLDLSAFRYVMVAGEELLTSYVERWLNVYPEHTIINEYGPTETAVGITTQVVKQKTLNKTLHTVPIGKPAINSTFYVVDSDNNLVKEDEIGELLIGGVSVARGYYNQPQLTAARFIENPFAATPAKLYRTGDLVKKLPDESYLYISRIDNQVKIDGYRIELNEIEHWLLQQPTVKHAKALVEKETNDRLKIVAYLVLADKATIENEQLKLALSPFIPAYMMPSHFYSVPHIPCNNNGKVDVAALKALRKEDNFDVAAISIKTTQSLEYLLQCTKKYLPSDSVDIHTPLFSLGLTSLLAAQLVLDINQQLDFVLQVQDLFSYPTIASLAQYIDKRKMRQILSPHLGVVKTETTNQEPIAIIAMDCRLPGANDCNSLWDLCRAGKETIHFFKKEGQFEQDKVYARGMINNIEYFDADFFNMTARDAHLSDPQHRLLIESAWIVLEKAGYLPNPDDHYKTGIFVSMNDSTYVLNHNIIELAKSLYDDRFILQRLLSPQCLATKIAYLLNCTGPSITLQTACSSSLVAIAVACQQLSSYACNLALAGGISLTTPQDTPYTYEAGNIFSPDGHCRVFDANAQGTVFSNGLGLVVLKRLSDAISDNDSIVAVIKGWNTNNDGANKMSFTAPSVQGQFDCILMAQEHAAIESTSIQYVEAHGTGTLIGDPVEIEALTKAFRMHSNRQQYCAVGSIKANMGHTHVAAGVAGLIKTALALQNRQIPPAVSYESPNPHIDWEHSPFYVNRHLQYWPRGNTPRRAAVSAFGVGGTNAHVILEESPRVNNDYPKKKHFILPLSAKNKTALIVIQNNLMAFFKEKTNSNDNRLLANTAYTLQVGRRDFPYRTVIVCKNTEQAISQLEINSKKDVLQPLDTLTGRPKLVFLFPGQGTQIINLSLSLYQQEPLYKHYLESCLELASTYLAIDLKTILFPPQDLQSTAQVKIDCTEYTHPILFSIEYALARILMDWGVMPDMMSGHSLGEYVAACIAGVFSLEEALSLVCERGKAIGRSTPGAMLVAPISLQEALTYCTEEIGIGAINAPDTLVFTGAKKAIDELEKTLIKLLPTHLANQVHQLPGSYSFHSNLLKPIIPSFLNALQKTTRKEPQIPYLSNLTGDWISKEDVQRDEYWVEHLLNTVQFSRNAEQLIQHDNVIFLELGAGNVLSSLIQRHSDRFLTTIELLPNKKNTFILKEQPFIENTLATLWCHGFPINWEAYHQHERRQRIELPTYPFARKPFWFDNILSTTAPPATQALQQSTTMFYTPTWLRSTTLVKQQFTFPITEQARTWIIFEDDSCLCREVIQHLESANQKLVRIKRGHAFNQALDAFIINPQTKNHYERAISMIVDANIEQYYIVHFWLQSQYPLEAECNDLLNHSCLYDGFYSGIYLTQAFQQVKSEAMLSCMLVSTQMQDVSGNEEIAPLKSCALSLCQVLPLENKNWHFQNIDVDNNQHHQVVTIYAKTILQAMFAQAEQRTAQNAAILALRYPYAWKPDYQELSVEKTSLSINLHSNGIYLITGGLGAMGLTIADWLSKQAAVNLCLLSRTALPPQEQWDTLLKQNELTTPIKAKIQQLQQIKNRGSRVNVVSIDVANYELMKQLINSLKNNYGTIHGIFHLAGVAGEGLAVLKSKETMLPILSPKIQGSWVLAQLFKNSSLDFLVCASSLTSIVGGVGQIDYCAANLFLDYFITPKQFKKCAHLLTINWNSWQSIGMAAQVNTSVHKKLYEENSIIPNEAMNYLNDLLNTHESQVIISKFSPEQEKQRIMRAFSQLEKLGRKESTLITRDTNNSYITIYDRLKGIWERLFGVNNIHQNDSFYSLGGDSLLAIQLLLIIKKELHVEVSLQELAHVPTLEGLAQYIETRPVLSRDKIIVPLLHENVAQQNPLKSIYFIHPLGGTIWCYLPLMPYLDHKNPCFGIQDPELKSGEHLFESIEEMANYYSQAILNQQKEGSILLIGASFGGNLAVEMVSPLTSSGITVEKVILIDSWANLGKTMSQENSIHDQASLQSIQKFYGLHSVHYQLIKKRQDWLRSYIPSKINRPMELLVAEELLPVYQTIACENNGWTSYCLQMITSYVIMGNHDTMLAVENAPTLGNLLNHLIY